MQQERRHAAIIFTDIVGYTVLMGSNEDHAYKLLRENRKIHQQIIKKYNGTLIKEIGDGTLISLPLSSDAVRCAIEIQKTSIDQDIPLKIGIHEGEVVFEGSDVIGDGVNIASRLQEIAEEGSIIISGAVYGNIKNKPDINTEFLEERVLKNVNEPVKTYKVSVGGKDHINQKKTLQPQSVKPSIAVLPFVNMSNDPEQEYFCDGITEEIINALCHIEDLKVIARTSAFMFKDKHEDMRTIGKKLDVAHLLEGSVRKAGNRIRITGQLIKVSDGSHLWSEKYDREIEDIFTIQDDISMAIVDALKPKLLGSEKKAILKRHTDKAEVHNLYLLGRFYTNKRNEESLNKGIEYFEEAIKKDPGYALAFTGLSEAYALIAIGYGKLPSREAYPKAKEAALKAIELDPELAEAHTSLGFIKHYSEFDWIGVKRAYQKAIELNPGYAPAHQWYGEYLFQKKKWEESYVEICRAIELDPLSHIMRTELAWYYHYKGNIDLAINEYKKVVEMAPDFAVVHFNLGIAYSLLGKNEEAIKWAEQGVELSGGSPFTKAGLAFVCSRAGQMERTRRIRDELLELANAGYLFHGPLANVYVALNDKDEAIKCLKLAYKNREVSWNLARMWYEDYLGTDLLSEDPWFIEMQKKMGLE
jgi:TolB-like protein/Tfp pilus assembly protein PilF